MQFGIFYEHQLPRPWVEGAELKLFQDALDQVELADKLGIDYAWEVEHHFLEEYAHSSAPEVFLAACSQRTKRIRLGHGIVLMPPPYNHPARVAERIATLDLVSAGRVEWGTGESASLAELGGFGISVQDKQPMWQEATREAANMMVMDPYPGYQGKYFSMPCRNVVPKPVQKPHPPIWVAASRRATASARSPSRSSIPPKPSNGWANITTSSSPRRVSRSATASTPTSRWSAGSPVMRTPRRRAAAGSTGSASSATRSATIISSASTCPGAPISGRTTSGLGTCSRLPAAEPAPSARPDRLNSICGSSKRQA